MLIAISQRNDLNKHGDCIDSLENSYMSYFEKFGIKLLAIPNSTKNIEHYFKEFPISGVILSGGNDVNPELYNGKLKDSISVSKIRDETERKMLEISVRKGLPVLGICRGMQFINVFFKGGLVDIKEEIKNPLQHVAVTHNITVSEQFKKALGNVVEVNSYHNQGISLDKLSPELKAFAQTNDSIIEGLYHPRLPIIGVQWHPERKSPDNEVNNKIVEAFLNKGLFWER